MSVQRASEHHAVGEAGTDKPARIHGGRLLSAGLMSGGMLTVVGAMLPWLTFFAGLQHYSGMIGLYGRSIFWGGVVAFALGLVALRWKSPWLIWVGSAVGGVLLIFALWLVAGLYQVVSRQETIMLVPRAGPGLFIVAAGAGLILVGAISERIWRPTPDSRKTAR